ncbi:hypothetical protein L810_4622 [Burkholderia sp. AU4i]|nr:hypothetical protein L810_4622 [Burkholderia sp. AU4i]
MRRVIRCLRHSASRQWVGPAPGANGIGRHACAWGTHAAAGHRCRGGLKAHAPSFGRPGFATGSSGSSDAAAHACGRRPGRGARVHAATRGRRHGSTPYASIADDSEVVRNRPIKCCDGFHSISHYLPAPAIRGDGAWRDGLTIREILTGGPCKRTSAALEARVCNCSHARRARGSRYIRLRRLACAEACKAANRSAPIMGRRRTGTRQRDRTRIERGSNGTPRMSTLRERIPSREAV